MPRLAAGSLWCFPQYPIHPSAQGVAPCLGVGWAAKMQPLQRQTFPKHSQPQVRHYDLLPTPA